MRILVLIYFLFATSVNSTPLGAPNTKSNLYKIDNGVLEGGYNIAGSTNDASANPSGGGVALNTNYAEAIKFNKNPNGASNTQTAGTTGVNAALQLPVVDQKLITKYGKKN